MYQIRENHLQVHGLLLINIHISLNEEYVVWLVPTTHLQRPTLSLGPMAGRQHRCVGAPTLCSQLRDNRLPGPVSTIYPYLGATDTMLTSHLNISQKLGVQANRKTDN